MNWVWFVACPHHSSNWLFDWKTIVFSKTKYRKYFTELMRKRWSRNLFIRTFPPAACMQAWEENVDCANHASEDEWWMMNKKSSSLIKILNDDDSRDIFASTSFHSIFLLSTSTFITFLLLQCILDIGSAEIESWTRFMCSYTHSRKRESEAYNKIRVWEVRNHHSNS